MRKFMKAIAAIMLTVAVAITVGCTKTDDPNNGGNNGGGSNNIHSYVDLGLPSGTLWATCNVGAVMPYEYGHYFAWGETERKEVYEWSTYKYSEDNKMTKYCNISDDGYEGFTDNLTILESGDDAATVNWGSGWRTPTKEQWEELIDNTNGAWTTQNEVYGRVFYGNGQSIFLPAAGDRDHGSYWSSSLDTNYPIRSWYFHFSSRYFEMSYDGIRLYGFSVRPVRAN